MSFKERRKSPRVDADFPINVGGETGEATGRTINISTNGIYFESPRFIEPLTKVRMDLVLPASVMDSDEERLVEFDGVVVRVEPEKEDKSQPLYKIAIFFTFVPKDSMEVLKSFISSNSR